MTVSAPERTVARDTTSRRTPARGFFSRNPVGYLLPALVLLLVFAAYPLVVLFQMAFSDVGPSNIVGDWHFVGWANFAEIFTAPGLWLAVARTVGVSAALLASNLVIGFVVASILSTSGKLTGVVLGVLTFVWALPPLVSGSVWKFLLDDSGGINAVLQAVGLPTVSWLSSPTLALWTVTAVIAWAALPFSALTAPPTAETETKARTVGCSMLGVTTPCVTEIQRALSDDGLEVHVFHANGTGGKTLERMIRDGHVAAVADVTTTELADELLGGVCSAGDDRLTAAASCGVPQVVSVGALDMVNFGPRETVPERFAGRR